MASQIQSNLLLGVLFYPCAIALGFSAYQKLAGDIRAFEEAVVNYRLLPRALVPIAARLIIGLELLGALALIVPVFPMIASVLLALIGGLFTAAQGSAIFRGLKISCGCHGAQSGTVGWKTIVEPMVFLLCGVSGGILQWLTPMHPSMTITYVLAGCASYWFLQVLRLNRQILRTAA